MELRVPTHRAIADNHVCSINNNSSIDGKDGSDDGLSKRQRIDRDSDNGKDNGGDEKDDSGYEFIQKSDVTDPTTSTSATTTSNTTTSTTTATTTANNNNTNSNKEEEVETFIPFSYCLDTFLQPEIIDMFHPAMNCNTSCAKTLRFKTFPKYLMVKMARYYVRY